MCLVDAFVYAQHNRVGWWLLVKDLPEVILLQLNTLNHAVAMCHCEEVTQFIMLLYSAFAEESEIAGNEALFPQHFHGVRYS